nr:hypothetical protein [Rubrivivax gelatinosus]
MHAVERPRLPVHPVVGAIGLAGPRLARLTARRAFVTTKHDFLVAAEELDGSQGDWIRRQIRAAEQPSDLWLLRGTVFAALGSVGKPELVPLLRGSLATLFPYGQPETDFLCTTGLPR